jgi:hypothetical protein
MWYDYSSMDDKTAKKITSIRLQLHIPVEGFQDEKEALSWYREHYQQAKGKPFYGSLGYRFSDPTLRCIDFDYEYDDATRRFSIASISPIDKQVPLDQHVMSLAQILRLDALNAPALRLIVLMGRVKERLPEIAVHIFAALGTFHLLVQSPGMVPEEQRKQLLDNLKLPSANIVIGYWQKRKRQKIGLYLQVYRAYFDWVYEKKQRQEKGEKVSNKGYLVWIAKRLVENYGWKLQPSSYTVKRYLDRAKELWDMPILNF